MKIYVVTETIPYEGSKIRYVTTDRNECFAILHESGWRYIRCEVWEDGKKVSQITYDFHSKSWKES